MREKKEGPWKCEKKILEQRERARVEEKKRGQREREIQYMEEMTIEGNRERGTQYL